MKYVYSVLFIIVLASPLYSADLITIEKVNGKVEIREPGGGWEKAIQGSTIPQGSIISTGFKSSAELDLSGSSTIYVKPLTRMAIDELATTGNKVNTKLNLRLGRIKADVKTSKGLKHDFTLKTPVSTAAVRGTVFEAGANGNLDVETGKIQQRNKIGQKTTVPGGNSSSVAGGGYSPPATPQETVNQTFTVVTTTQPSSTVPELPPIETSTTPDPGTVTVHWGESSGGLQ